VVQAPVRPWSEPEPGHARIRLARLDELNALIAIEVSAGEVFREIGMSEIADDDPGSVADLLRYQSPDHALVAVDKNDIPVAYLLLDRIDDALHVEQVSVRADYARQGIGRDLIGRAARMALDRQLPAVTLTTFRDVPWNAPYYRRIGFETVPEDEWSPGLSEVRASERRRGLDRWPRVVMRLRVGAGDVTRQPG
jgi:GNAT superfamily N-acetyltransferase